MISIIIPCYNVQDTIRDTIASVLAQTCDEFEIIAVDDGSTDGTYSILEEYSGSDKRIKLIHKNNGGVSSARNLGLSKANGEYVLFLDGDDTINSNLLLTMKKTIAANVTPDMVIYGFYNEKSRGKYVRHTPSYSSNYVKDYLYNKLYIHLSSFIIRRDVLISNSLLFDEHTYYSEDREFVVSCLWLAKNIIVVHDLLFCYRWSENSVMRSPNYTEKRSTSLDAMERVYKLLQDGNAENAALAALKVTIILHWKMFYQSFCSDFCLRDKLEKYSNKYLNKNTYFFPLNRVSIFSYIMGFTYYRCHSLFITLLKVF